ILEGENIIELFIHNGSIIAVVPDAVYDISGNKPEMLFGAVDDKITTAISYDSSIWISTSNTGLISTKVVDGITEVIEYSKENPVDCPKKVTDMVVTNDNELWLTSSDLGIVYYETNSFNRVTFSEGRRFAFSSIAYDPISGTFWCGTWGSGLVNLSLNRSEEHTSELQSRENIVCRLLIE